MILLPRLSVSTVLLFAASTLSALVSRQSDPSNTIIGGLRANGGPYSNYVVSATTYNPTGSWDGLVVISLNPPVMGDRLRGFTYSLSDGRIDARMPNWGLSWRVPGTTGPVTLVELTDGRTGLTYVDGELRYNEDGRLWWGCTSIQKYGVLVLYVDVGDVAPNDGECTQVRITGA